MMSDATGELSSCVMSERLSPPHQLLQAPQVTLQSTPLLSAAPLGLVVAKNATASSFAAFVEANGRAEGVSRKFFLNEGDILMSEAPTSPAHKAVVGNVFTQVGQFNLIQTGGNRPLIAKGNCPIRLGEGFSATPDCVVRWRHTPRRASLVVEALHCDDCDGGVAMIKRLAEAYLSPSSCVEAFVGIKLMHPVCREAPDRFRACAFVFRKGCGLSPVDIISFGTMDLTEEQRAHIVEVMGTGSIRGCAPSPPCSADIDYFVDIPWDVFETEHDEHAAIDVPWVDPENNHSLRLSLFSIQEDVALEFAEMEDIPLFPDDDPDHLRCKPHVAWN